MSSYTFRWEHPANEVYVTGSFDNWGKTVKMDRKDGAFEKTVDLPQTSDKILYKFVADGQWTTDHTKPSERDGLSNINNIVLPEQLKSSLGTAAISSAAPGSTTAQLAGEQPKESTGLPGAFPETPGEKGDEADKTLGVNPLPATAGAGNPIHLKPGEKVPDPSTITSNTIDSTASTDRATYEKSGSGASQAGGAGSSQGDKDTKGEASALNLPPVSGNMIPESSLPMGAGAGGATGAEPGGANIQSAAPNSTTAQLAGLVPKEETKADGKDNASEQKDQTGSTSMAGKAAEMAVGGAAAAGAAVAGAARAAQDKVSAATGTDQSKLPKSVQNAMNYVTSGSTPPSADNVPKIIADSEKKAHESPEAAANPEAVKEKSEVEDELLKKVKPTNEAGPAAPTDTAATAATAPGAAKDGLGPDSMLADHPLKSSQEDSKLNAPADQPAQSGATEIGQLAPQATPSVASRDISPMSKPPTKTQDRPIVTTGVDSSKTGWKSGMEPSKDETPKAAVSAESSAPQEATPEPAAKAGDTSEEAAPAAKTTEEAKTDTAAGESSTKAKRRSLFGKLKDKFGHHEKK